MSVRCNNGFQRMCLIKLTMDNKQLHSETNLLMYFVEEVSFFSKKKSYLVITYVHFSKNATNFIIAPPALLPNIYYRSITLFF